ncbi:MAG: DUF4330 family protein [Vicinamibacterales bacterium]
MPLVDARGRLFGKVNLIDLGVLVMVVVLIPLGYGAYLLFRPPLPRISEVSPARIPYRRAVEQPVRIKGEHLQPFLKAKLNDLEARGTPLVTGTPAAFFAVDTPQDARIGLLDVLPGVYDLALFDETHEVARFPKAIPVSLPPVLLVGGFDPPGGAPAPGAKFGPADRPFAEVVSVSGPSNGDGPEATLRANCEPAADSRCGVAGATVQAGQAIKLPATGGGSATFMVRDVRVDRAWLRARVHFVGLEALIAMVHPGDVDHRLDEDQIWNVPGALGVTQGAIVRKLGELQKRQGTLTMNASQTIQSVPDLNANGVVSSVMAADALDADLDIPVETTPAGFRYGKLLIQPGSVLIFEAKAYRLTAIITNVIQP